MRLKDVFQSKECEHHYQENVIKIGSMLTTFTTQSGTQDLKQSGQIAIARAIASRPTIA